MARIQVRKNDRTVLDVDVETFLLQYLKISPPFKIEVSIPFEKEKQNRLCRVLFRGTVRENILVEPENSCGECGHPLDK